MPSERDRDPREAQAVADYVAAIEVPPVPLDAIARRAERLRRADARGPARRHALLALPAIAAAAAVVVVLARGVAAPGTALHTAAGTRGGVTNGLLTMAPRTAAVTTVTWHGRTYVVSRKAVATAQVGRLLVRLGPPADATAARPPAPLAGPAATSELHAQAIYALRGAAPDRAVCVMGTYGAGPHAVRGCWRARVEAAATVRP